MRPIPTKVCKDCERELELGFFTKMKTSKDGHNPLCRTCNMARAKKTPSYNRYSRPGGQKWKRMDLDNNPN